MRGVLITGQLIAVHTRVKSATKSILFGVSIALAMSLALSFSSACAAQPVDPILSQRLAMWEKNAPKCGGFPTKWGDDPAAADGKCNDGDMNLFSGLLCAAGVELGCQAVKAAMRDSGSDQGRWFRSPRHNNDPSIDEKAEAAGVAAFSPDMALGTQLYLATKKDTGAAVLWANWLNAHRPCLAGSEPTCDLAIAGLVLKPNIRGWPRFCTNDRAAGDDSGHGCTMRPGDLANLAQTRFFLKAAIPGTATCSNNFDEIGEYFQEIVKLDKLVDSGLPRLLDLSCGLATGFNRLGALFNKPGYSQHLVGVEILLMRTMGISDPLLAESARQLAEKQPQNPFFAYLNEGNSSKVQSKLLELCPSNESDATKLTKTEWAWERADSAAAWHQSSLWDCVFMGHLLTK